MRAIRYDDREAHPTDRIDSEAGWDGETINDLAELPRRLGI